mmetsp:Transcript_31961/g.80406  ORF Transcript_31961/g.80406 Transcript_31961/m.80406 type:complete len:207 (+) Transcript_31961:1149-1769(+)
MRVVQLGHELGLTHRDDRRPAAAAAIGPVAPPARRVFARLFPPRLLQPLHLGGVPQAHLAVEQPPCHQIRVYRVKRERVDVGGGLQHVLRVDGVHKVPDEHCTRFAHPARLHALLERCGLGARHRHHAACIAKPVDARHLLALAIREVCEGLVLGDDVLGVGTHCCVVVCQRGKVVGEDVKRLILLQRLLHEPIHAREKCGQRAIV